MPGNTSRWIYENTLTFRIYAKKGGLWSPITDYTDYTYYSSTTGGTQTFTKAFTKTFAIGSGATSFGVSLVYTQVGSASLNSFSHVKYTGQASQGTITSAVASGVKSTVTVRPQ